MIKGEQLVVGIVLVALASAPRVAGLLTLPLAPLKRVEVFASCLGYCIDLINGKY